MQNLLSNLCIQLVLLYGLFSNTNATLTFHLVSSIPGELDAGNYSHYTLHDTGDFKLELRSQAGDADLYVTDKHRLADFSNYEWQSVTYGTDEVFITDGMTRPIAISVYAHPYYPKSTYVLNVYSVKSDDKNYEAHCREAHANFKDFYYSSMLKEKSDKSTQREPLDNARDDDYLNFEETDEDNESILWTIFINLLKLIAEIIL